MRALSLALVLALAGCRSAAPPVTDTATTTAEPLSVTVDNFNRAESHMYFSGTLKRAGGLGKFNHRRELGRLDQQGVIRANRDTLYSEALFDLDAAPVTVTLPDPRGRFQSMIAIDEEQYTPETVYGPGRFTYTKNKVGSRYLLLGIRTFVDPSDPADLDKVHALQDAIKVEQAATGTVEFPNWDPVSQKKVRDALLVLAGTLPDTNQMYGPRGKVDPIRHLIGTATGWGANAPEDATYVPVVPAKNDGKTVHRLTIKGAVPVDGFWSISVYGADGYFHVNDQNVYSINGTTAKKDADGSITIQFGGCDGTVPNCIPITEGWNYWVRFYRPRKEILAGIYKFPKASAVAGGSG
jgi:hypothetical protein